MSNLTSFTPKPFTELAPDAPLNLESGVSYPTYGRYLEEFFEGQVFHHPRAVTLDPGFVRDYCGTFMEMNPLFLSEPYAQALGFRTIPVAPMLAFNLALSLGVHNDSEKAMANLGYYDVHFPRPLYAGDTLRSMTKVLERKERGEGKPGIVTIRTLALNQNAEPVVIYTRKIMVNPKGGGFAPTKGEALPFPDPGQTPVCYLPKPGKQLKGFTNPKTYFEDFTPGEVIVHANGRTITDEHVPWTYKVGNTHPLHYDRLYSTGLSGAMSGEPIVYGGLVFSWLTGLAGRDTSDNALWDFGFHEGYHTQPAFAGETVTAISRVVGKEDGPGGFQAGVVTFQLIGMKNIKAKDALKEFGADLFIKENDKKGLGKEKISAKIFEIERRLLILKRG